MQLDLSHLPAATYFVKVTSKGQTKTVKLIKQQFYLFIQLLVQTISTIDKKMGKLISPSLNKKVRHLVTMPHIERSTFQWNWANYPDGRNDEVSPWLEAFVNARKWLKLAIDFRQ